MRVIFQIARVGATKKTAQDAPGATIVNPVDLQVPLIFQREGSSEPMLVPKAVETFRGVEDDVDAATPVDAQNAPTGVWKSRTEREIPTASTSITLLEKERERTTKTAHTNCPQDRIRSTWPNATQ